MQLNQEQFDRAKFIGVYGRLGEPQLREPVREFEGAHYDLFGRPIDISGMFLIATTNFNGMTIPVDQKLNDLGVEFCEAVEEDQFVEAQEILDKINARADKIAGKETTK